MNKSLNFNSPIFKILAIFLTWRICLIAISFFAIQFIPLEFKDRFLGGGPTNYAIMPQFFSWANFDGEHYLSISIFGYKHLEQAFFPFYPKLISVFSGFNPLDLITSLVNSTLVGLIISNASFLFALIFLFELIRIDLSKKIAYLVIVLMLIFPTSFYFGALYNESLFLLLSVLSFYFARRGNWFYAGVFGMVASVTRVFGVLLLPALLLEAYTQKTKLSKTLWLFLIPIGLGIYMMYLNFTVGDPLAFYHFQKLVGEQHQAGVTLLPQIYFRYIKMIISVSINNPIFQTVILELFTGIVFFLLPIYGYIKKIRFSYLVYAMLSFLAPTIQGSFSSSPRYVVVLFPSFLAAALLIAELPKLIRIVILLLSSVVLVIETALFLRGYWVA